MNIWAEIRFKKKTRGIENSKITGLNAHSIPHATAENQTFWFYMNETALETPSNTQQLPCVVLLVGWHRAESLRHKRQETLTLSVNALPPHGIGRHGPTPRRAKAQDFIEESHQVPVHRHRLWDNVPFSEAGRDLHLTVKASFFKNFLWPTKIIDILYRDSAAHWSLPTSA